MRDLTKEKLISLGFEKNIVTPEEAGDMKGFYYFSYPLFNSEVLISCDNESITDDKKYYVEFLTMPDAGKFYNSEEIIKIVKAIKREKTIS